MATLIRLTAASRLMAQSGRHNRAEPCPLSGDRRLLIPKVTSGGTTRNDVHGTSGNVVPGSSYNNGADGPARWRANRLRVFPSHLLGVRLVFVIDLHRSALRFRRVRGRYDRIRRILRPRTRITSWARP
jgi:hypothetical protein